MSEETFLLAIHVPINDKSMKPYKMINKLCGIIDTVTKNYNRPETYYNEKTEDDKVIPEVVFVFKFYDKTEYDKVNELLRNLNKAF